MNNISSGLNYSTNSYPNNTKNKQNLTQPQISPLKMGLAAGAGAAIASIIGTEINIATVKPENFRGIDLKAAAKEFRRIVYPERALGAVFIGSIIYLVQKMINNPTKNPFNNLEE